MAEQGKRRLPRWLGLLLAAATLLVGGFALWALAISSRYFAAIDTLRVHELSIAADNLAKWPKAAIPMGRANLFHVGPGGHERTRDSPVSVWLYHPELGDYRIQYGQAHHDPKNGTCKNKTTIEDNKLTVEGEVLAADPESANSASGDNSEAEYLRRARAESWLVTDADEAICFKIGPLDLRKVAPLPRSFSHLLLAEEPALVPAAAAAGDGQKQASPAKPLPNAAGDNAERRMFVGGQVIAQIGPSDLPVRKLSDLPKVETLALTTARATLSATGIKMGEARPSTPDALEPINSRVAGKPYRFYLYPIVLGTEHKPYYLVGVAPASGGSGLGGSGADLMMFALVLAILIALVPVVKLAMLGPVDGLKPLEVTAVFIGLLTASALATSALIASRDILRARDMASDRLKADARTIALNVTKELIGVIKTNEIRDMSRKLFKNEDSGPGLVTGQSLYTDGKFVQPNSVILVDRNGRQPLNALASVSRDWSGADYNVADRAYFLRALQNDFAPGSEALRLLLAEKAGGMWKQTRGGLVFDQVRSYPDGVPKTIIAAALEPVTNANGDPRKSLAVIATTLVLKEMLAPQLGKSVHYAVVDTREAGWPVIFHSVPARAHAERFHEGLSPRARTGVATALRQPVKCDVSRSDSDGGVQPFAFSGKYQGEIKYFAASRIPCTDWLVVTFKTRDIIDRGAALAAGYGILIWTGLAFPILLLWILAGWILGPRAWRWLWPDPRQRKTNAYWTLVKALALVCVVATIWIWIAPWPMPGGLLCAISVIAAFVYLARIHHDMERGDPEEAGSAEVLSPSIERWFTAFAALVLISVAVVPVASLAADARGYFGELLAGADLTAKDKADEARDQGEIAVARAFSREARYAASVQPRDEKPTLGPCSTSLTASVRALLAKDALTRFDCTPRGRGRMYGMDWMLLLGLVVPIVLVLGGALWWILRGLFGFGVALEAVSYPPLPGKTVDKDFALDRARLPARFMAIALPDAERRAMCGAAAKTVDLVDATAFEPPPAETGGPLPLVLFINLEMILRDTERRREALRLFEAYVNAQTAPGGTRRYSIGLLAELSPLDRLLQSYERELEELEQSEIEKRPELRRERARHREDMRWSRLFEEFTTFIYSARPRTRPADLKSETPAVQTIVSELEYLPDHAVAAMIPDPSQPLEPHEIVDWANEGTRAQATPRAIVDHLASLLIEHYHHMWSVSSRAERLLLYRFAHGQLPNIGTAYSLRSLVRRGLVVLDPSPRIMNRSFAQFVRHAEKPETLEGWRLEAESGLWQKLRTPISLVLPVALGVIIVMAVRSGESLAALVPVVIAAGPALIHAFSTGRRDAAV